MRTLVIMRVEEIKMKIVGIIASPHADGNGATLVRSALAGAHEAGATASEVLVSDSRIEFCRDCRACMKSGRCCIEDDFHEVRARLMEADGIILSSPTYGAAMSARIKNLFDRLGQFAYLTSLLGGKYVVGIATAGSFGAKKVARQLARCVQHSVFNRGYVSGTLGVHLRGKHVSSLPGALQTASSLGRKLVSDFRAKRTFPLQNLLGRLPNALVVRPLIRKGIEQHREAMSGVHQELVRLGILSRA
jgi:multimeric flavodoxin WrbA